MSELVAIQGVAPRRVESAGSIDDYAARIAAAAQAGESLVDYGLAHHDLGHPPPADFVHIAPPAGVLDHYIPDMTVRVAAGTSLADLQAALAQRNQYLPLDGAAAHMTLAEIIAHNVYGPARASQGNIRDLLLGLHYVNAAGHRIKVGGRTVKNVAGYDVTRFMVGNLNTLGLIAEATVRTAAIPPQITRLTITGVAPASLAPLVTDLLLSDAAPYAMRLTVTPPNNPLLHITYADTPRGCNVRCDALKNWLVAQRWSIADTSRHDDDFPADLKRQFADADAMLKHPARVKLIVPPASTGKILEAIAMMQPRPTSLTALPTHGVIHLAADWSADDAAAFDKSALKLIAPVHGMRLWLRRPDGAVAIRPFAPPQSDWPLMHQLKYAMDPDNCFNPGRFP
ncbi:MAG: FAD-binding protein [Planctomycetes bacterium]|nr:FAD-binding protein [Planctomycetota bacterium]